MPKYSRGSSHVNKRLQPSDAGRKAGLKLTVGPLSKRLSMETRMRVLGLALAGTLASLAPIVAHGGPPEGWRRAAPMGPPSAIVQIWDGRGSVSWHHAAPNGFGEGWHFNAGRVTPWNNRWCPPHWGPNRFFGGSGFYGGPAVPTYWVWGPRGGAFDYPDLFALIPGSNNP